MCACAFSHSVQVPKQQLVHMYISGGRGFDGTLLGGLVPLWTFCLCSIIADGLIRWAVQFHANINGRVMVSGIVMLHVSGLFDCVVSVVAAGGAASCLSRPAMLQNPGRQLLSQPGVWLMWLTVLLVW